MVGAGRKELASLFWRALGATTVSHLNNTTVAKCVVPTTHASVCICSALHTVVECSTEHYVGL